jgi:type II secretory pathway component PulJ
MDRLSKIMKHERGLTLIEVVIAQVILLIGAVAVWSSIIVTTKVNAESEDRTIAANIAQLKVEEIMNRIKSEPKSFLSIESLYSSAETAFESEPQDTPYWTLSSEGLWIPSLPGGRYMVSYPPVVDADPAKIKRIKVTVLWNGYLYSDSSLSVETLAARSY